MGINVGSVVAEFKSDLSDFKKGLMDVKKEVSSFADQVENVGRTAMKVGGAMTLALTVPIVGLGTAAAKAAADYEQSGVAFETMLGSAEKAATMLKNITDMAMKTPFQVKDVETGAKQLLAYGISAESVLKDLSMLGDIASGVGMDKLPNLILAFGQVNAATRLTGMELRQFTEAGVPMLQTLADQLGKPVSVIQDMVSEGQIGFKDVEKALSSLTGEGGKFFNLMEKQSKTTAGQMSNLQDNITKLLRAFGAELLPTINRVVDFLNKMTTSFQQLSPEVRQTIVTVLAIVAALGPIILIFGAIINAAGMIIGVIQGAAAAFGALAAAIGIGVLPLLAIIAGIAAVIAIGVLLYKHWDEVKAKAVELWGILTTTITDAYNTYILPILTAIGATFTWLWESIIKPVIDAIVAYYKFWYDVLSWVWNNLIYPILYLIAAIFLRIFYEIFTHIKTNLENAWNFWSALFAAIWAWVKPWLEVLAAFFGQIWEWITAKTKEAWGFIRDHIIDPLTAAKNKVGELLSNIWNSITEKFNQVLNFAREVWSKIKDAIVGPFEEAKRKVEQIAQAIKDAADKINPFHRESPSLVDNVRAGVKAIEEAYSGLGMNLNGPSITQSGLLAGVGAGGNVIQISLAGANITDPSIAEDYAERIGDAIMRKLSKTARVA